MRIEAILKLLLNHPTDIPSMVGTYALYYAKWMMLNLSLNHNLTQFIMKTYSQNKEDLFVSNYFGDNRIGTLLDIGANDGLTFSNSRLLLEKGWKGHLVEPASVYTDLNKMYLASKYVQCYKMAISDELGEGVLFESGAHVPGGEDKALVSSLHDQETRRWRNNGVQFQETKVTTLPFNAFWELTEFSHFDFISIDAEGCDLMILKQIDLKAVNCQCLVIEHNGNEKLKQEYISYCAGFGLRPALSNRENLIFIR